MKKGGVVILLLIGDIEINKGRDKQRVSYGGEQVVEMIVKKRILLSDTNYRKLNLHDLIYPEVTQRIQKENKTYAVVNYVIRRRNIILII